MALIDSSLPEAAGQLGGFAKFSGAKFSLPPAGLGLVPLAGTFKNLNQKIEEVLQVLELSKQSQQASIDQVSADEVSIGHDTILRKYHSIVLTPDEINQLIARLTSQITGKCVVIHATARKLIKNDCEWQITLSKTDPDEQVDIYARTVFYAAGRLASDMLLKAGAKPLSGKGLDIGVRIEFLDLVAVKGLRALGPDAKLIRGSCRTFCLNSPGKIYRYPYQGLTIPGGVVADASEKSANVGLLIRVENKEEFLRDILERAKYMSNEIAQSCEQVRVGFPFQSLMHLLSNLFNDSVALQLEEFSALLGKLDMVNWSSPYRVHLPLIDWYWPTYCESTSHKTSLNNIYALGDSSGHARGLLQASLSGWIAAEEYLDANAN